MANPKNRAVGLLALACVTILIVHSGRPGFSNASRPAREIPNSVVALQMARSADEVDDVLGDAPSPDREAMRIKQYIDFAFIAAYAGLYIALARMFRSRIATIAAICGVAAAVFDIVENVAILRILDVPLRATTQAMVDSIRYPSLAKWTLAFAATALFGEAFWMSRLRPMQVIAALNFAAAAIGFYGLYDNAFLVWAGLPMLGGLAAMIAVFLFIRR